MSENNNMTITISEKSVFQISLTVILISLFFILKEISVEFIKSSNPPEPVKQAEPAFPPFFMMPPQPQQQSVPQKDTRPWAGININNLNLV